VHEVCSRNKEEATPPIFWLLALNHNQNAEAQLKCYLTISDYQTMLQVKRSQSLAVDVSCAKGA